MTMADRTELFKNAVAFLSDPKVYRSCKIHSFLYNRVFLDDGSTPCSADTISGV
jgi:hypothetical protein